MRRRCNWLPLILAILFVLPLTALAEDEVICFGDSATEGAVDLSFPDYLEAFIEWGDGQVVNEGESGETSDEGLDRMLWLLISFQYTDSEIWTYFEGGNDLIDWVEDHDPTLLYDPASPNYPFRDELDDLLADIKDNLRKGVRRIRFWTSAEPILGTYYGMAAFMPCDPSPIGFLTPGMVNKANHYRQELNDIIREVAEEEDAVLVDIELTLGNLNGNILLYHDCNHMNALGNFFVALAWFPKVAMMMN